MRGKSYNDLMKKVFLENAAIEDVITIDGDEFLHLAKVLRTQEGEKIVCLCGDDFEYLAQVLEVGKKRITARVLQKTLCAKNPKCNITLFQGLAKGEKMELITQKCTELGISNLCPFESNFTIAKANALRLDRLTKITQEACKQCGRSKPIAIHPVQKLKNIDFSGFDLVIFLYEKADPAQTLEKLIPQIQGAENIAIIVGAEGGFAEGEAQKILQSGAKEISLGARILRAETAAIALSGFISFIKNN